MVANDSEQIGRELNDALTTQGIKFGELQTEARRARPARAAGRRRRCAAIHPPGPLRLQHQQAIEALEFRVSGLRGLADGFRQASRSPKNVTGNALSCSSRRPRASSPSDVVWDDLFQAPAQGNGGVLQREGITGVAVPGSSFVPSPDYASSGYWEAILQRLQGAATTGGTSRRPARHGARRDGKALPGEPGALADDREHRHRDHRPRLRGHGRGHGRLAGGAGQGDADDPAEPVADRPDEDDRPDQPGRAEDGRCSGTSARCSSRPGRR